MSNSQTSIPARRAFTAELSEVLPGAILTLIMSGAVIYSLATSAWAPRLDILIPMSLPALLLGIVFARLRTVPSWVAHLLSTLFAIVWMVQVLGELMSDRIETWRDQGAELLIRSIIWGRVLASGGRGEDILLFIAALCLLCWILAYSTAWMVFRKGWVWAAVIINAGLALINYTYVLPKPTLLFFIFLGAALLLLVYQHILQRQALWDAQKIEYPDLLPIRFVWSAALVCGLLILITANLPGNVTVDRATRTWSMISEPFKVARERWEDAFATLNAPPGAGSGAFTSRNAQLGGARQLNTTLVMTVRSTEFDYWRAVAFDRYSNNGWQNTIGEQARSALGVATAEQARTPRTPGEIIPFTNTAGRREVVQTFTLATDRSDDLVMVGGTARSLSIPTLVEHNYVNTGGNWSPNYDDTALIVTSDRLNAGSTYTVTALVSRVDIQSLRGSGSDYPAWVRERYLQLPDTITQRTRELAAQIVTEANATTPYDQAIAIQNYLRTLRYNEAIPAPPSGSEPVDWFLFEQQEGYCDYFASSMVVMLRSLDIPARWVRGYAGGDFNVEQGVYEVRENVAHSWPEVYFAGFGWERFEPTAASYTALPQRPLTSVFGQDTSETAGPFAGGEAPDPSEFEDLDEGLIPEQSSTGGTVTVPATEVPQAFNWIGSILGGIALFLLLLYLRWAYEMRGLSSISASYAGMEFLASWSGIGQDEHTTPIEYAQLLSRELPDHRTTIQKIAAAYQGERYHRKLRAETPEAEDELALRIALIKRIFTSVGERISLARNR